MKRLGYLFLCLFFALGLTISIGCKEKKAKEDEIKAPFEEMTPEEEAPALPAEEEEW